MFREKCACTDRKTGRTPATWEKNHIGRRGGGRSFPLSSGSALGERRNAYVERGKIRHRGRKCDDRGEKGGSPARNTAGGNLNLFNILKEKGEIGDKIREKNRGPRSSWGEERCFGYKCLLITIKLCSGGRGVVRKR